MIFTGKNTAFKVIWNCTDQCYRVYKNDQYIITGFRYRDIVSYLD